MGTVAVEVPLRRPFAGLRRMVLQTADAADAAVMLLKHAPMTSDEVAAVIALFTLML